MPFKKGHKLGKGRSPIPDDVRGLKLLNQREVELIFNELMNLTADELAVFAVNKKNTVKKLMVAQIMVHAINKGDHIRLDFILNRLLGKPKEVVEHNHKVSYHDEIMAMIEETEEENAKDVTPKLDYAVK